MSDAQGLSTGPQTAEGLERSLRGATPSQNDPPGLSTS